MHSGMYRMKNQKHTDVPTPTLASSSSKNIIEIDSGKIVTNDMLIDDRLKHYKYSLLSLNIRSLSQHIDNLRNLVSKRNTDFICVSEIFKPYDKYIKIPGFHNPLIKTRPNSKMGGGVALYISSKFSYVPLECLNNLKLKVFEIIAAKVNLGNKYIYVASLYRPPNAKLEDSFNDLEMILSKIEDQKVILAGDVNINVDPKSNNKIKDRYLQKLLSNNLEQVINTCTRLCNNSSTLIDHIISNILHMEAYVLHESISDHQIQICMFDHAQKNKMKQENRVNIDKIHIEKTLDNIKNIDWVDWESQQSNLNIDCTYESFHSIIQQSMVFQKHKTNKYKCPEQKWMTVEILKKKD